MLTFQRWDHCAQELDEFQSYVLVRRWSQEAGEQLAPDGLSQKQRTGIQAFYFSERGYINSCLDFLLQSDLGGHLLTPIRLQCSRRSAGCDGGASLDVEGNEAGSKCFIAFPKVMKQGVA